jgi:hypothetical protein
LYVDVSESCQERPSMRTQLLISYFVDMDTRFPCSVPTAKFMTTSTAFGFAVWIATSQETDAYGGSSSSGFDWTYALFA